MSRCFRHPSCSETMPTLIGYYRLLLGASENAFYGTGTGMSVFKSMELNGTIGPRQRSMIPDFCRSMSAVLAELIRQISPTVTSRDVDELRLLTLGSQFQGANNVNIGK